MDQLELYPSFVMLCAERSEEEEQEAVSQSKIKGVKPSISKSLFSNQPSSLQANRLKSTIVDCTLSKPSQDRTSRLKDKIKHKLDLFDLVLVSPLLRALQTYVTILGENSEMRVVIEPLLAPQLNCGGAIGKPTKQAQGLIKGKLDSHKVEGKIPWYVSNLPSSVVQQLHLAGEQSCLQILKTREIESVSNFQERIERLKTALVDYRQTCKKKILIVSHPDVLETLTATCIAQDGSLVNPVSFAFGEAKEEYIVLPDKTTHAF